MTGSVFKRTLTSGRAVWCLQLDLPPGADGKRQRVFRSGFKRKSEADEALQRLLAERNAGALVKPDPRTFASFLADWFSQHAERQCSPKTIERYRQLAEYVLPHLGHLPLSEITPLIVERLLNHLKDAGGRHRKTGEARSLSARTVRHIAGLLSVAFRTAVRWKLLRQSPMESVQLPRLERVEKAALDAEQLTWYLDTCRAKVPWLYPILLFAAATGCRRGEVLALRWQDLDLGRRVARIARSLEQTASGLRIKDTKTGRARLVPLPPSVVSVLESVRAEQAENRWLHAAAHYRLPRTPRSAHSGRPESSFWTNATP